MKRTDFIKNLIGLFGIAVLPPVLLKQYTRLYLLQCFIRGFRFYDGPSLIEQMKEGDLLEMVREPENEHDECAIALHFNKQKIGYIPAEENDMLSRLMDADVVELLAEITHLKPEAAAWENVHIAIYVLREDKELSPQAAYLTMLDTPDYYTLKHSNDKLTRFSGKAKPVMYGEDFYDALIENNGKDKVYTIIQNDIGSATDMQEIVDDSILIINRKRIPADLEKDDVLKALDEGMVQLDDAFNEDGFVVAQVNRVAELSSRIKNFKAVVDKQGRRFFEVGLV